MTFHQGSVMRPAAWFGSILKGFAALGLGLLMSCSGGGGVIQQVGPGAPTIASIAPTSGTAGITAVTITGTNLDTVTAVNFGTSAAVIGTRTATQLATVVPISTSSGAISVTGPGGTAVSTATFTVINTAPVNVMISGPETAITGHASSYNLSATDLEGDAITFSTTSGAIGATISGTVLTFTPTAAGIASLSVIATDSYGAASAAKTASVVVTANAVPHFSSAPPSSGVVGSTLSYTPLTDLDPEGDTISITKTAGPGTFSGGVLTYTPVLADVTTSPTFTFSADDGHGGVTVQTFTLTVASSSTPTPTIANFAPPSGPMGTSVVITGTNLSGASLVKFNNVTSTFVVNSATQITATIPSTTTGLIAVTTPGGTATSSTAFTVTTSGGVAVDCSLLMGPSPYLYRLGVQSNYGSPRVGDFPAFGNVRLDLGWSLFHDATSLADVQSRLATSGIERTIAAIRAAGGEVTLNLVMMPPYLSSQPGDMTIDPASGWPHVNAAPPTSLVEWSKLVEAVVTYIGVTHGLDVRYEVWNEPDLISSWRGTRAEFYALYRASALGARRALASAKVGGPVLSSLDSGATALPITDGWMREFIAYCARTPIPELSLARTPLDFVVWHEYGFLPRWAAARAPLVRTWLADAGYPSDTTLIIDEWNINLENMPAPDVGRPLSDTEQGAANAVATIFAFDRIGLDRHAFSAISDWSAGPPEFHGGQGLLTANGVRKPVYQALRCLDRLTGQRARVTLDHPSPFISAAASVGPGEVALIVASCVPDPRSAFSQAAINGTPTSAISYELSLLPASVILGVFYDSIAPESLSLSSGARQVLIDAQRAARDARAWQATTTPVTISVTGLPSGLGRERRYAIDSTHANSYRAYLLAKGAGADELAASAAAESGGSLTTVGDRTVATDQLVSVTIQAEPNAVWLIIYTAPGAPGPSALGLMDGARTLR